MGVYDGDAAFLSGGDNKGIIVEGVMRAAKKVGSLSSSPSESPPAPVVVGVGVDGAGIGGARGGGDVGVPQVRPAKRPFEEEMLVMPGVKGGGLREGYPFSAIYAARKRKKREEEEEEWEGGGEGVMAAGGGGAVSNVRRRRRRRDVSENPLGAKIDRAGATTPPQQLRLQRRSKQHPTIVR